MKQSVTKRTTLGAAALSLALFAAACGSEEAATPTTEAESAADGMEGMEGMEDSTDMDGMNMGDASATRADEVAEAALATGEFALLDTRPEGFDDTSGNAWIARHSAGTTVTVELAGLVPEADYISHLHNDVCANDGGDHYQFEVGGSEMPPNEIHLAFTSDADGNGFMTAENHQIAGLDAVAFVVHPAELMDNKIACVDFVEIDEGAAAAMIEQGADHMDGSMEDDSMDGMEMDGDSMNDDSMEDDSMNMDDTDIDADSLEDDSMEMEESDS